MTTIDEFSLATVPIEQMFNNTSLGNATGFVWTVLGKNWLVTNWHVVTGRRFPLGKNLRKDGGRPNKFRLLFNVRTGMFGKQQWDVPIRDEDGQPLWFVHPSRNVDVAVLYLPISASEPVTNVHPINSLTSTNLSVRVGMDVFVLGYPFGAPPPGFPVWKRGSIASEPDLASLTTDYFLVDTASRPGMSGAPVIRRSWGSHLLEEDAISHDSTPATRFIGIYSGRLHTSTRVDAQLGIVWPADVINEIIAGATRDKD